MADSENFKKQLDRQNKWITEKLDRINLTVSKGKKDVIKQFLASREAAGAKPESVNAFINRAIDETMERETGKTNS